MDRRRLLKIVAGLPFASGLWRGASTLADASPSPARVRPGDPAWPSEESWDNLNREVSGRLIKVRSPLAACVGASSDTTCAQTFKELKNPYYLGDEVGLTQSLGWVGAWTSEPSVYAVAAKTTADVVATVNFARKNNLRLVVKGGGHSYQGSSNAANSLLIWTRQMNAVTLQDAFVGAGCEGRAEPQPAVSIEAGAIWGHVYNAVMTKAGRYVQGGGCLTVGVAGLVLGGGFGSYSKAYGLAGANLIEAEVVTADGEVRTANACTNPDLFWALKGGGGGFGSSPGSLCAHTRCPISLAGCSRPSMRRPTTPIVASSPEPSNSTLKRFSIRIGANKSSLGAATSHFRWPFRASISNRRKRSGNHSSIGSPLRRRISPSSRRRKSSPDRRDSAGTPRC